MKQIRIIAAVMRLPNVVIIILTMFLLRYGLLKPFLYSGDYTLMSGWLDFSLLVLATVLISVAGYIINDMYDAGIDAINKPGKNKIGYEITNRSALLMYRILNGIALIICICLAIRLKSLTFGLIFPFVMYLLWIYSFKYKKVLVFGNVIIALLAALVVFVVWYFEFLHLRLTPLVFGSVLPDLKNVSFFFVIYASFAFFISLSREIIKDIEDKKGDEEFSSKTIAIAYGDRTAKIIASAIMVLTIFLVVWYQQVLVNRGWTAAVWYFAVVVQLPIVYIIFRLFRTTVPEDYHFLSNLLRIVMVAGVLSIQLINSSL